MSETEEQKKNKAKDQEQENNHFSLDRLGKIVSDIILLILTISLGVLISLFFKDSATISKTILVIIGAILLILLLWLSGENSYIRKKHYLFLFFILILVLIALIGICVNNLLIYRAYQKKYDQSSLEEYCKKKNYTSSSLIKEEELFNMTTLKKIENKTNNIELKAIPKKIYVSIFYPKI